MIDNARRIAVLNCSFGHTQVAAAALEVLPQKARNGTLCVGLYVLLRVLLFDMSRNSLTMFDGF